MSDRKFVTEDEKYSCAVLVMKSMLIDMAGSTGRPFSELLAEFAESETYNMLFDTRSGMWREGPDFLRYMYERTE